MTEVKLNDAGRFVADASHSEQAARALENRAAAWLKRFLELIAPHSPSDCDGLKIVSVILNDDSDEPAALKLTLENFGEIIVPGDPSFIPPPGYYMFYLCAKTDWMEPLQ